MKEGLVKVDGVYKDADDNYYLKVGDIYRLICNIKIRDIDKESKK